MPKVVKLEEGFVIDPSEIRHSYWFRPNTSDERVLQECLHPPNWYYKKSIDFAVKRGERWLDLGANIGAFGLHCATRGAFATCYEPDAGCFSLLRKNLGRMPKFQLHQSAVSVSPTGSVSLHRYAAKSFRSNNLEGVYHRNSLTPNRSGESRIVANTWVGDLPRVWDGIKIDIEGAEGPILDSIEDLPWCNKLAVEYHWSRDNSLENLANRLKVLKDMFSAVFYVSELDRLLDGEIKKPFQDRVIFCVGNKKPRPV